MRRRRGLTSLSGRIPIATLVFALFGKSEQFAADAAPGAPGGRQKKRSAANGGVGGANFLPGLFGN